ncbi:MAG: DUF2065 domain-containing protein [Gammaproteobacteria bacterium]|jgi:uncharacterized protein YjeT (DUF2065 family)|nr:DUF2065 domain-containing protein [Gammaproteobacteria bacterium]
MNWSDLLAAFALYLVIEGLLPFASPRGWKQAVMQMARLSDQTVRWVGLFSMILGLILLFLVRD